MKYSCDSISDMRLWDAFVAESPQGSVFCTAAFLAAGGQPFEVVGVREKGELLLGAVLIQNEEGLINPLSRYQGILFAPAVTAAPQHKVARKTLDLLTFLLAELGAQRDAVRLSLHPSITDLRALQWFHYHEPEKGQFELKLRYTGVLDIGTPPDAEAILAQARTVRRQECRRADKRGYTVEASEDLELLIALEKQTLARQEVTRSAAEEALERKVLQAALRHGFGSLLLCRDPEGAPAGAAFFLHDQKTGFYLIGANDPAYRKEGTGSYVLFEQIRRCKERGLTGVDFCGINSPNRGDFKTSFNAQVFPFYEASWNRG